MTPLVFEEAHLSCQSIPQNLMVRVWGTSLSWKMVKQAVQNKTAHLVDFYVSRAASWSSPKCLPCSSDVIAARLCSPKVLAVLTLCLCLCLSHYLILSLPSSSSLSLSLSLSFHTQVDLRIPLSDSSENQRNTWIGVWRFAEQNVYPVKKSPPSNGDCPVAISWISTPSSKTGCLE